MASTPSGASAVEVKGVRHTYDNGEPALHELDFRVESGVFCTLLGPSGSGKTTLLRIIAGLLKPTAGQVSVDGEDVTNVEVQQRDIGFVFQNYALFPHLTVAENIAFPLRIRRRPRKEQERRVAEILELVSLGNLRDRYPAQLSGGQQQRVAIGRALVFDPRLLLLDEPLGALDRRLRQQLGAELRAVQQKTQTTAIYVTHDQEEAFLLSDRVVVMNEGRVRQEGPPVEVYTSPNDLFVATFLGDTNILHGRVREGTSESTVVDVSGVLVECQGIVEGPAGGDASFSVRPEDVVLVPAGAGLPVGHCWLGEGQVERTIFLGSRFRVDVRLDDGRTIAAEVVRDLDSPQEGAAVEVGWRTGTPAVIDPAGTG